MADSNIKELYDFLVNYDLIQSDLNEEEAQEFITSIYDSLEDEENLLTGFIADTEINNSTQPRALFITNNNRILYYPDESSSENSFLVDDLEYVDEGDDNSLVLKFNNRDDEISIKADNQEGIDLINDALYSSLAESMEDEQLDRIFGEEEDEDEVDEIVETAPEEEIEEILPEDATQEVEIIEDNELIPVDNGNELIEEDSSLVIQDNELTPTSESDMVAFTTETEGSNLPETSSIKTSEISGNESGAKEKKKFHLTKPMIYTIAGIGVLALILVGYLIYNHIATNQKNQEVAGEIVDYLNQVDKIYFSLKDYQAANFAGVPVEDLDTKETDAEKIADELLNIEPTEGTDELYQNLYFYDDALISAIYYGRTFINTQNQLNRLSFDSMLDAAYRYRLTILSLLRQNFPDMLNNVEQEPDMDLDAEYAEQDANSTPTEGELNRQNTTGSSENVENSISTREEYMNSKNSKN